MEIVTFLANSLKYIGLGGILLIMIAAVLAGIVCTLWFIWVTVRNNWLD